MVVYSGMMQPGGLDSYWQKTCDPATVGGFNGGAHFEFLNRIVKKSRGSTGFAVGEQLTIAGEHFPAATFHNACQTCLLDLADPTTTAHCEG